MPDKLLVTGANGQLGTEFCRQLAGIYKVCEMTRKDADITDLKHISKVINRHKPDYVIHTAAFTDVDGCELDGIKAMAVNAIGAKNVALAARKIGAKIIYFSTDYVFDGAKTSAYVESDLANPISEYGRSKYAGELAIIEASDDWTIVRIGWIYGDHGKNFIKSILAASTKTIGPIQVVIDQFGSPTWTKDIVFQTARLIEAKQTGLYHVASKGEISRYDFARIILTRFMPRAKLEACATGDFPRPAPRPARSTLKSERLDKLGIDIMPRFEQSLSEFLEQYGEKLINEISH